MTVAAVHSKSHENPLEISHGFHFEENTLDKLPLDEVVEGVNRELDLMQSFPVHQAVPRVR